MNAGAPTQHQINLLICQEHLLTPIKISKISLKSKMKQSVIKLVLKLLKDKAKVKVRKTL